MKATEQYFPVVLFIMMYKLRWFQLASMWMKPKKNTIQMKATEQYFPVVLFYILYKVVPAFESVTWMKPKMSSFK